MTVIPLRPHRCTVAENGDGTPCDGWAKGECEHVEHQQREQAVRCWRCWDTMTWNLSGWCDQCETWRANAEKSTGPRAAKPSTGHREHPLISVLSAPELSPGGFAPALPGDRSTPGGAA